MFINSIGFLISYNCSNIVLNIRISKMVNQNQIKKYYKRELQLLFKYEKIEDNLIDNILPVMLESHFFEENSAEKRHNFEILLLRRWELNYCRKNNYEIGRVNALLNEIEKERKKLIN